MERIIDTSILVSCWRRRLSQSGKPVAQITKADASNWAIDIAPSKSRSIVTPVAIEFLAGARNAHEIALFRSFLDQFQILDRGVISREDWVAARRIAERVPRDSKPRQLGDCLIRAVARRLGCDVWTNDEAFPK